MINEKILIATKWSIICEIITKIISPITTIILARLLAAEVFGIVASVMAIISLADLLTDAGFNAYIVQHQFDNDVEKKQAFNVCFWSNFTISNVLLMMIIVNRYTFSALVGASGFEMALVVASIVLPLTSISSIEQAIMKKELKFKTVGLIRVTSKIVPFITTIPLALLGMEYWSLIIGTLIGEIVNVLLCLKLGEFVPCFFYSFACLKKIFAFSIWAFMESILEWFIANIAILTLGSLFGIYYLGIFKAGINIISQITASVYSLYSNVYKSAIAREQNNPDTFKKIFLTFQKYTSIFSIPIGVGALLYKDFVTDILLGTGWQEAAPIIGLWGVTSMLSIAFGNFYSDAIRAKGYPQKLVSIDMVYLVIIILVLLNAHKMTFEEFCVYFCAAKIVQPILQILIGQNVCKVSIIPVLKNCYPQFFASMILIIVTETFRFNTYTTIIQIGAIGICIIIYFIVLLLIHPDRKLLLNYIYKLIN